ncbi:AMP-binding protein [Desulfitibacter alkalitolerans]|uniref:AMP-binding protein n=1 Tax=Desulfitibacter alkalitolerans TaxID=264641 RepID=UPI001FA7430D|nr:AMP-binding protein [Desulfitibacter alkalitolerans]
MCKLLYFLYKAQLLSPLKLYRLAAALNRYGINLMALLYFANRTYAHRIALVDDHETLNYKQLFMQSLKLSTVLKERYQLKRGYKVGLLCKNHASLVKSIFAVSLLGADIHLLNAEMSSGQFNKLLESIDFNLLIYDDELGSLIEASGYSKDKIMTYHNTLPAVNNLIYADVNESLRIKRNSSSRIVLLTGGTTGNYKTAAHEPSLFNFLDPLLALCTKLKLFDLVMNTLDRGLRHLYS